MQPFLRVLCVRSGLRKRHTKIQFNNQELLYRGIDLLPDCRRVFHDNPFAVEK